jgi:hypothetical protein
VRVNRYSIIKIAALLMMLSAIFVITGCSSSDDNPATPNNAPNAPANPNPANGGAVSTTNPTLFWSCTDPDDGDALTYDLYLGTDSDPTTLVGDDLTAAGFTTDTLQFGTTYYWKVVAGDGTDETAGAVWQFSVDQFVKPSVYFFDDDIKAGETRTLHADTTWILSGFVFVEAGATLNVEAGTVIKARPGEGINASALIICKDGKINAVGTADNPIIMTAEADDVDDPDDLGLFANTLWGGLIILGNAVNNDDNGVGQIEGIPSDEPRGAFGGTNDADNSGTIKYISIRHGGSEIGQGNEINGLTLGSVGSGTTIDYIEIYANLDDGVEFFGGKPNAKHIAVAFCGDDGFDYDEGFRGNGQFWFVIQQSGAGNHAGEHDGATGNEQGTPYAIPTISNATYIGSGESSGNSDNDPAIIMRDNAGGRYYNSVFYGFTGEGLIVEDVSDPQAEDSRKRLEAGDIVYEHNIWYAFGPGNTANDIWSEDYVSTYMEGTGNNTIVNPMITGIDRMNSGGLNPAPSPGGPASSGAVIPADPFFDQVDYLGAFDPGATPWIKGWTALDHYGFLQ